MNDLSSTSSLAALPGMYNAFKKRLENSLLIGVPLLGSLACIPWFANHAFSWIEASSFLIGYTFVGLGVTLGLHRFFSHKSFRPQPWLAFVLGVAESMAFQGSILRWAADHKRHHAHTDYCGDLHSPYIDSACGNISGWSGMWHAHVGWMFDSSVTDYNRYAKDLCRDPTVMFFHRTHWLWPVLSLLMPWFYGYLLGGPEHAWGCLFFGGCLKTTLLHNFTWAVNSLCHTVGSESYPQKNHSKNNLIVALFTFGEGWHNNHHRFPNSAFQGLQNSEPDITGIIITWLERIGLAKDVVRVPPSML